MYSVKRWGVLVFLIITNVFVEEFLKWEYLLYKAMYVRIFRPRNKCDKMYICCRAYVKAVHIKRNEAICTYCPTTTEDWVGCICIDIPK